MRPFEDAVAGNVVSFLFHVFFYPPQDIAVVHPGCLEQVCEVVDAEVAVGASVGFARAGRVFGEDFLAGEGGVAAAAAGGVSADVAVGVADVVAVVFVEGVVGDELEGLAPED